MDPLLGSKSPRRDAANRKDSGLGSHDAGSNPSRASKTRSNSNATITSGYSSPTPHRRRPSKPTSSSSSRPGTMSARQPSLQLSPRDLEEALALHQRSCTLFQPVSRSSTIHTRPSAVSTPAMQQEPVFPSLDFATTASTFPPVPSNPALTTYSSPFEREKVADAEHDPHHYDKDNHHNLLPASSDIQVNRAMPENTVMHWNLNCRRYEYEQIERSHTGIRGLVRQLVPKCLTPAPTYQSFYDASKGDQSDCGSVRRYRLDLPPNDADADDSIGNENDGDEETRPINEKAKIETKTTNITKPITTTITTITSTTTPTTTSRTRSRVKATGSHSTPSSSSMRKWMCF